MARTNHYPKLLINHSFRHGEVNQIPLVHDGHADLDVRGEATGRHGAGSIQLDCEYVPCIDRYPPPVHGIQQEEPEGSGTQAWAIGLSLKTRRVHAYVYTLPVNTSAVRSYDLLAVALARVPARSEWEWSSTRRTARNESPICYESPIDRQLYLSRARVHVGRDIK